MTSTTKKPDLPAASGLTGLTTDLPEPGDFPELDAQTQVPVIIAISVVLVLFSATLVLLRLHTRYRVIKAAGLDDISIGVAQVIMSNSQPWRSFGQQLIAYSDIVHRSLYHHNTALVPPSPGPSSSA